MVLLKTFLSFSTFFQLRNPSGDSNADFAGNPVSGIKNTTGQCNHFSVKKF